MLQCHPRHLGLGYNDSISVSLLSLSTLLFLILIAFILSRQIISLKNWYHLNNIFRASLVAQTVRRLSTMRETWVQCLGREDPLERETATHSSTTAWKILWTEEPDRLQSMGWQRVGHD